MKRAILSAIYWAAALEIEASQGFVFKLWMCMSESLLFPSMGHRFWVGKETDITIMVYQKNHLAQLLSLKAVSELGKKKQKN